MQAIATQKNEARCWRTKQSHTLEIPPCCPMTGNPLAGSTLIIDYEPKETHLEVASLRAYVDSYVGGKGDIRSMEGMIQQIAADCASSVGVIVHVRAELLLEPRQRMNLDCAGRPQLSEP